MADISEKTAPLAEKLGCYFIQTDVSQETDVQNMVQYMIIDSNGYGGYTTARGNPLQEVFLFQ